MMSFGWNMSSTDAFFSIDIVNGENVNLQTDKCQKTLRS